MTKTAWIGLVILAVLVGLFAGYWIWIPDWHIPYLLKYEILRDTLTIVLTVLAVGIAIMGYAMYLLLSEKLKGESAKATRLQAIRESIQTFVHIGFVFWESYDKTGENERECVEVAIGLTERALLFFNQLPEDEVKTREGDKLLCKIKNNLAYYYALRNNPEDDNIAKEYAEYIKERVSKYREEKDNWLETYDFVCQKYPA